MRIAVLGLGLIGSIWAKHWRTDGHEVRGWNRTPKPDHPTFTSDLVVAVQDAEVIAVVVSDGPVALEVLGRIAPQLDPGITVCLHSTVSVDECRALRDLVTTRGAAFLDMPFTGSKPGADNRTTVFYVGDDHQNVERVRGIYEVKDGRGLARILVPMGAVGQAMAAKLALNLVIAGVWQATAEALALAEASGVSPATFFAALEQNAGRSGVADLKKSKVLAGDVSPQFAVALMRKDLRLAQGLARNMGLPLPLLDGLEDAYTRAGAKGRDVQDYWTLLEGVREGRG